MRENMGKQEYALGSTAAEHARLIRQAAGLAPVTERLFREAGIGAGHRVLDLGSGVGDVAILAARRRPAALRRVCPILGVFSSVVEIFAELIHAVLHFANAVGDLAFCKGSGLGRDCRGKVEGGEDRRTAK